MSDLPTSSLQAVVNSIRALSMDAVQNANSGHPGMPMGMADAAAVLWTMFLKFDPRYPHWPDRDRFILSAGHGSMLLYSLLHLSGYDLPLEALQNFRQWNSPTPGHPEYGHAPGVETTTGPLGQGISNAVGFALAEQWLAQKYNRPNFPIVNHSTYVIASDGDLMEGVSHEACALAGHLGLGKLIVLYDDNGISIDGSIDITFTEDVLARFRAYGWHTSRVNGHDRAAVAEALEMARAETARPSLIACRTIIGYGSPNKANTASAHGEPLGEEEIRLTKEALGLPQEPFWVDLHAYEALGTAGSKGAQKHEDWNVLLDAYGVAHPELAAEFKRVMAGELPRNWEKTPMPEFGSAIATRAASGQVLNALATAVPELLGGSADLTGSNKTDLQGATDVQRGAFDGRYLRFGVREHGMGAIMNGMSLHGGIISYGGTFLVFSDYMRPTIRLAALMGQGVIYVFTHDSIGLGEDGPTHQPIEHLAALRAIPNLVVLRPADAWETAVAWKVALARRNGPTALALTRQKLPLLSPKAAQGTVLGGYILAHTDNPQVILMGSGSEVHIALAAQKLLAEQKVSATVVSMPSWELFKRQSQAYRDIVLPPTITARVAIEAGVTLGWEQFVGSQGAVIGINHFGASAPYQRIYQEFGLTPEAMAATALELL